MMALRALRRKVEALFPWAAPDLPFGRDDANSYLPLIVASLVFMVCLMLSGWLSLSRSLEQVEMSRAGRFSVHISAGSANGQKQAEKALEVLEKTPGVTNAAIISAERMREWVQPWLGDAAKDASLPLPIIIEAEFSDPAHTDEAALIERLKKAAPAAKLDRNTQWMSRFSNAVSSLRWVSLGLAAIFAAVTAAVIAFTVKTGVKLHAQAVHLLHSIGALDAYIARQFQINAVWLVLQGALIGTLLAAFAYVCVSLAVSSLNSPLLPSFRMTGMHFLLYLLLPLCVIAIAWIASKRSVLSLLQRMP